MAFGKWNAVINELREQREALWTQWEEQRAQREREWAELQEQRERSDREWAEQRERSDREWAEQRAEQREHSDRQWKLSLREHHLNRRCYEEGMELCRQLVERNTSAFEEFSRSMADMRSEIRAQTQALLRVIDRMDRLDGGSAAA